LAKDRRRLFVLLALAASGVVVGLVVAVVALDRYLDPFDDRLFDTRAWAAADSQGRGPMARDAIRHLPEGLPAARVRELLGNPDPFPGPGGTVDGFGNRLRYPETWAYYLGSWSSLSWYGLDSAFLYVHFGQDGRVASAEITGG
jgi:hypothetical protein